MEAVSLGLLCCRLYCPYVPRFLLDLSWYHWLWYPDRPQMYTVSLPVALFPSVAPLRWRPVILTSPVGSPSRPTLNDSHFFSRSSPASTQTFPSAFPLFESVIPCALSSRAAVICPRVYCCSCNVLMLLSLFYVLWASRSHCQIRYVL